jgi:hypothetical protein
MDRSSQGDQYNKTSAGTSMTIAKIVVVVDYLLVAESSRNAHFGAINSTANRSCLKNLIFFVV